MRYAHRPPRGRIGAADSTRYIKTTANISNQNKESIITHQILGIPLQSLQFIRRTEIVQINQKTDAYRKN